MTIIHFTGRTWRPPYEAHSVIIQATSGCTYNKCKFCSLYKNECFRMSPIEEFEEDLAEIKGYQPYARRIFWTGANPFAMSYENLKLRALTVRDYLIKCQTMAMFASIRDIKNKEIWQLRKLRAMELYQMAQQGLFVPAEEKERIRELQMLINNLNIRTHLFANTVSNFTPVTAYLPYDREKVTNELQFVLDHTDESELQEYRNNLKSLG